MLTSILERNSWIIYKLGMPLVFFYHLLISSVLWNTAADDAHGIEKLANTALAPVQYFFDGKNAILLDDGTYQLERRFDYDNHFFIKAAASATALPFSIVVGGALKSASYLFSETRERSEKLYSAVHSRAIHSNLNYYQSIGMQVEDYRDAEHIAPPKWKRQPNTENRLKSDTDALESIVAILSKHEIPFWVDCGSCLGCYQYGGSIPGDWDIDIAILSTDFHNVKNALQDLDPKQCVVQDWSSRARPETYLKVYVCESGGMIDIYNFAIDEEKGQVHTILSNEFNIFLPTSWVNSEKRYVKPISFDFVFPLKKATFEGIEVPVPGNVEKYLQNFYGENLAPARIYNEISGCYEKDPSHPYWQMPHAH